jgi:hypothetical protein
VPVFATGVSSGIVVIDMAASNIPVEIRGIGVNTYILGSILVAIITTIGILIRAWPNIKRIDTDADMALRHDLLERLTSVEAAAVIERAQFKIEMQSERDRCAAMEATLKGQIDVLHGQIHELRNLMVELTLKGSIK